MARLRRPTSSFSRCSPSCAVTSAGICASPREPGTRLDDLGDLPSNRWAPSRSGGAHGSCENLTAADALFVALAEHLGEPLLTKDSGLASAARDHARIETLELGRGGSVW